MSSLLDEAIIDAIALKEAALKNAETLVLEKYALDVKDALKSLLEQEEPMMPGDPMAGAASSAAPDIASAVKDVQYAHADGQKMCPCKEDEEKEEITLDLNQLADALSQEEEMGGPEGEKGAVSREQNLFPSLEESQEYEVQKDELLSIFETLTVDMRNVPYGNIEYPANTLEVEYAKEVSAAKKAAMELEKENEDLKKENKSLNGRVVSIQNKMKEILPITEALADKVEKYESAIESLQEKLESVTTSNARLLYTNRVLSNNSLNERQKQKLVDALSNAKSAEEAKVMFETLQSTMESEKVALPKSLSEAINRTSSSLFKTKQQEIASPITERMQRLAGIK